MGNQTTISILLGSIVFGLALLAIVFCIIFYPEETNEFLALLRPTFD